MDATRTLISNVLLKRKEQIEILSKAMDEVISAKSAKASEASRKYGNKLYKQKNRDDQIHKEIFAHYCKSIATAPNGSEQLTLALANRSALLLHVKRFQDCVRDIDRALNMIGSNIVLKIKLLCRKAECLKKLGLLMHLDVLKEAESCINQIDEKSKDACDKLINKVKRLPASNQPRLVDENDNLPETQDILDRISIAYTDDYGRHLIAEKDYEPGDIIFVEKLYATNAVPEKSCVLCNYCLKYAWSGVPCENCDWAVFCSEECKQKAWKEFHDIECTLIPHLKLIEDVMLPYYDISLRLVLLGIRETGGIVELKEALQRVDDCQDQCSKGFYTNEKFASRTIQSVYSLKCDELSDSECETVALGVILILIEIVKYSKLIDGFTFQEIDDLTENEDVVFLGFLLLKLIKIKSTNSFWLSDKKKEKCEKSNSEAECAIQSCCVRGSGLSTLSSLINHSCFPNASKCFTEDLKIVVYALQPIKKSSQIFISYSALFYCSSLTERQAMLTKYKFDCNCEACVQGWPPLLIMTKEELAQNNHFIKNIDERNIALGCSDIFQVLDSRSDNFGKNFIGRLSKSIIQARSLEQPSLRLTVLLMNALDTTFSSIYGMKPPSFG